MTLLPSFKLPLCIGVKYLSSSTQSLYFHTRVGKERIPDQGVNINNVILMKCKLKLIIPIWIHNTCNKRDFGTLNKAVINYLPGVHITYFNISLPLTLKNLKPTPPPHTHTHSRPHSTRTMTSNLNPIP